MTPESDDATLMARVAKGDQTAFAVLVEKYRNVLLNFFLRGGVSYSDGEDLAQQTFVRLYNYRRKYVPSAKFTTFLFLVARQVRIDDLRRQQRRQKLEDGLVREAESAAETPPPPLADGGDEVRRAVAGLSPVLRDVVELGVFQDLPYAEVAKILAIPVGTVKSRMFNALQKLKEVLDEPRS